MRKAAIALFASVALGAFGALGVLAPSPAYAAGGVGGKGDLGGKGGNGPGASSAGGSGGTLGGAESLTAGPLQNDNPDTASTTVEKKKKWEVGGTWETHRLIRQEDLDGAAANKLVNVLGVHAWYDLTANDRIGLRDYFYERFLADSGETGIRSDDLTATYTRTQRLPAQFTFAGTFAISAPTSFDSRKMSLITAPTLILQLDKKFGKYVGVSARTVGVGYIVQYASAQGGGANPKYRLGGTLEAEVTMPFHEALSFGADIGTSYIWTYNVQDATEDRQPDGTVRVGGNAVGDATYPNQPIQQRYVGEIFARYTLPQLVGIKSDILVALAQGDPSLGSASVLHDGVKRVDGTWRQTFELYGALSLRY